MRHDSDLHALTGAYALHALEPGEREEFTAHLGRCASCRRETAGFEATTARLAGAVALQPPAGLKGAVLHGIDSVRQLPPQLPAPPAAGSFPHGLRRRAGALALAAALVAAASLGGVAFWQHRQAEDARQQAQTAERRAGDVAAVIAAPDARTVHGRAANGATTSVVSSRQQDRAVFIGSGLPDPGAGRTYQLWFDDHGTMRSAGLLDRDGATLLEGGLRSASGVGLTLEPAGGSARPTTDPLLLLALPA